MNEIEFDRLRDRVHKVADEVQGHEFKLHDHAIELKNLKEAMDTIRATGATAVQLANTTAVIELKLDTVKETLSAIKGVMWWTAALLGGAFITALWNLIVKNGPQ